MLSFSEFRHLWFDPCAAWRYSRGGLVGGGVKVVRAGKDNVLQLLADLRACGGVELLAERGERILGKDAALGVVAHGRDVKRHGVVLGAHVR